MSRQVSFAERIESQHMHINSNDYDDIYVVGDVHGCRRELEHLLNELALTADDLVVFVGDLVRKGPDSRGVVELVRSNQNLISVRGNNEEKLLRGEKTLPELSAEHLDWIDSLPLAITWRGTLVTHAGIDPRKALSEHSVDELQNVRSLAPEGGYEPPYWFDKHAGPHRVFFGHTVLEDPILSDHAVGLDTGCVYGGSLTAYDVRKGETISVDAERTYEERRASKFLSIGTVPH